ncbi:MAG: oligosaccharide flippase family protein [Vicinamibacterales bacterium]
MQRTQYDGPSSTKRGVAGVLITNTVWNYASFAVSLSSNLLLFPFAVAKLGNTSAGIWLLVGSVSGYMGLLQLGLAPALVQLAAASIARREDAAVNRAASTALVLVTTLGLAALFALPAIPSLLTLFHVTSEMAPAAATAFVLGIVGVPLQMPGHVFNSLLSAAQRQDLCSRAWIFSLFGRFCGIFALLTLGFGLRALMYLDTVMILLSGSLLAWLAFRTLPDLRFSPAFVNRVDASKLWTLGGWFFVASLCTLLIEQTDRIVVGAWLTVDDVTHYSAGFKLYMLVFGVATTMLQAVGPLAATLVAREDHEGLRKLFVRMSRYGAAIAIPLACGVGLGAGLVLRVWMGAGFADDYTIVQVLLGSFAVTAYNQVAHAILAAMHRVRQVVWRYSLPQAILNAVLSIALVSRLGVVGVALGTMLPAWLLQYSFTSYTLTAIDMSWRTLFREIVRPTFLPAVAAFAPALAVYASLGPHSWWLVPALVVGGLAYVALFWQMLDSAERSELRGHVASYLTRRAEAA